MSTTLIPNYVDIDYTTMLNRLKSIMVKSDTFKDYDFEGSNIRMLMELVSYLGDVNTYYTNSLAKNIHNETADVYEVVHSLVRRQGHDPLGYVSSYVNLTLSINCTNDITDTSGTRYYLGAEYNGHIFAIPQWYRIMINSGENVWYTLTEPLYHVVNSAFIPTTIGNYSYDINLRFVQGKPLLSELTFNYDDIVDNKVYLPFSKWDHDIDNKSSQVKVNGFLYNRVDDITDYQNVIYPKSYTMKYDKYGRYYIRFTSVDGIPIENNVIKIILVESLGLDGIIGRLSSWDKTLSCNIYNYSEPAPFLTRDDGANVVAIDNVNLFELINYDGSVGGADPQTVSELKVSGNSNIFSQLRNVTPTDYTNHLIGRSDIDRAIAWGEYEVTAGTNSVDTSKFNIVYTSVIPNIWNDNTIILESMKWRVGEYYVDNLVYNNGRFYKCLHDHSTTNLNNSFFPSTPPNIDNQPIGATGDQVQWTYVGQPSTSYLNEFFNNSNVGPTNLLLPFKQSDEFTSDVLLYLSTRKMIGVDELCILPSLVYFKFDVGIRAKRSYAWPNVKYDVESKLLYYFTNEFRSFGDIIDINDILTFLYDTSITSPTNDFVNIQGVQSISFRNVSTFSPDNLLNTGDVKSVGYIYSQRDPNNITGQLYKEYPFYMYVGSNVNNNTPAVFDNYIKPIKLGFRQYPILSSEYCNYYNEGR